MIPLAELLVDVPALRGLFVTLMPDYLLYDAWMREGEQWRPEEVAAYFGDLVRANREGLKALGAWSQDMQVTIESGEVLLVLVELHGDFVIGAVFDRGTPLGMIRLHLQRVLERLEPRLPKIEAKERHRGVAIMEFLERYAPDPHAIKARLALQTRIPRAKLTDPTKLSDEEVAALERAAKEILGLDELHI